MTDRQDPASTGSVRAEWIAVDWGTTHLRTWAMQGGTAIAEASSADGMATLDRDAYEPALLRLIDGWLPAGRTTPVVACGMVGSRQGWIEAPYVAVPCAPLSARHMVRGRSQDPRMEVWVIPGLRQDAPSDVMRGEETQIAGLLRDEPSLCGLVCLPGTHTKWASIRDGVVQAFTTFMTGELYALLSAQSVLRHGLGTSTDWHQPSFEEAVRQALAEPAGLAASLFRLRADGLLQAMPPDVARSKLSGLLIGGEIAALGSRLTGSISLVGAPALSAIYASALAVAGLEPRIVNGANLTLAGLSLACMALPEHNRRSA